MIIVTIFNVFDLAGRSLAAFYLPVRRRGIEIVSIARIAFVPTFVLLATGAIPSFTGVDWLAFVLIALLALTNGYIGSFAMMSAPSVLEPSEREVGGTLMSWLQQTGLCIGSVLAILLQFAIPST